MLRPRIIPCLLIRKKGLVKTVKFEEGKYVGDPLNAVKIFNEKEVDELMILDIDASKESRSPDFTMIKNLALESRMPLCYGGGVKSVEDARKIISLGAEKVALSSSAIQNPDLVRQIAKTVGKQSTIVVLDIKKKRIFGGYDTYILNGKKNTKQNPVELAKKMEELGAGEIVINSIDKDGCMQGYDIPILKKIREATTVPLTFLGGAGTYSDINNLINEFGVIGAAAGSIFVFKGKYKAVLINYPNKNEKEKILKII